MTAKAESKSFLNRIKELYGKTGGIYIAFIVLFLAMSILSPIFLTSNNITSLLKQAVTNSFISFGMAYILIAGEIDLSVGATYAFSGVLACIFINKGLHPFVSIFVMLILCAFVGFVNGTITVRTRIPAFIVTLAMQNIIRGIAYLTAGGTTIKVKNELFKHLGNGKILGINYSVYLMIVCGIILSLFLQKTIFGRHLLATGGNKEAAIYSGIKTNRVKTIAFIVCAVFAGLAGIMASARICQALASNGSGMEGDAIAACVLGGVSFSGGRGTISGTLVGALTLALLTNGMYLIGVDYYMQLVVQGVLIIGAVILDQRKQLN